MVLKSVSPTLKISSQKCRRILCLGQLPAHFGSEEGLAIFCVELQQVGNSAVRPSRNLSLSQLFYIPWIFMPNSERINYMSQRKQEKEFPGSFLKLTKFQFTKGLFTKPLQEGGLLNFWTMTIISSAAQSQLPLALEIHVLPCNIKGGFLTLQEDPYKEYGRPTLYLNTLVGCVNMENCRVKRRQAVDQINSSQN